MVQLAAREGRGRGLTHQRLTPADRAKAALERSGSVSMVCGRKGRGGGSDSGRDRVWDRDRHRSRIGTDKAKISVRGMPRIPPG